MEISRYFNSACRSRAEYVSKLNPGAHVHLLGICGTGMAAVAQLLKQLGFYVTGSDKAFYPPMGDIVRATANEVFESYSAENLAKKPDLVVVGNALSRGNPELEAVLSESLPVASMPEVFNALLIRDRDYCPTSIVVAGTHGKTTTSAAVATLFENAGRKPAYFIGGAPATLPGGIRCVDESIPVKERVVVLEGDEYDSAFFAKFSKFQCYRPDILVVTSLEFDHADIFDSLDDIVKEFDAVVKTIPESGTVIYNSSYERLRDAAKRWAESSEVKAKVIPYGQNEKIDNYLEERDFAEGLKRAIFHTGNEEIKIATPLTGLHNLENLLVASIVAKRCGLSNEDITKGILLFTGVARRQQIILNQPSVVLIEDFAHHPTAVKVTLEGIREKYPTRRLVAVYEPRSNTSRQHFFQDRYLESFDVADVVVVRSFDSYDGYARDKSEVKTLDVEKLTSDLADKGKQAACFKSADEIKNYLVDYKKNGDLIVVMSNGDFDGLIFNLKETFLEQ